MRKQPAFLFLLAAAGLMLPACTPHDTGLGETVRRNMALHIIDPNPVYKGEPMEGSSGDLAANAQERYRKDKVKEPRTIQTTERAFGAARPRGGS